MYDSDEELVIPDNELDPLIREDYDKLQISDLLEDMVYDVIQEKARENMRSYEIKREHQNRWKRRITEQEYGFDYAHHVDETDQMDAYNPQFYGPFRPASTSRIENFRAVQDLGNFGNLGFDKETENDMLGREVWPSLNNATYIQFMDTTFPASIKYNDAEAKAITDENLKWHIDEMEPTRRENYDHWKRRRDWSFPVQRETMAEKTERLWNHSQNNDIFYTD